MAMPYASSRSATTEMGPRRCNPKGAWGLPADTASLVVEDASASTSSSLLVSARQDPRARPTGVLSDLQRLTGTYGRSPVYCERAGPLYIVWPVSRDDPVPGLRADLPPLLPSGGVCSGASSMTETGSGGGIGRRAGFRILWEFKSRGGSTPPPSIPSGHGRKTQAQVAELADAPA